jgi:DNA-binding transcriptional LysR family regulator
MFPSRPLSRQIRDLEDEIGVVLRERSPREVSLTPAGRVFLREARGVLRLAAEAVRKAREFGGVLFFTARTNAPNSDLANTNLSYFCAR